MDARDIRKIYLPTPYRVICIADIHGNFTAFKRLLEKVVYRAGIDYLFILGDLLERGREEEIPTIDYLYELSKNDRVHIISGNNDRRMGFLHSEDCHRSLEWLRIRPGNIFMQWAKTMGISDSDITEANYKDVITAIKQKHRDKIDFVVDLPVVIETDEFICVHSALDSCEDWQETSQWDAWFGNINEPNKTGKWIISGHSPNSLFSETTLLPIVRYDNKTISIDGGSNTVFFGGQLNALIIEKSTDSENIGFSYDCADKQSIDGIITKYVEGKHNEENHEHLGNVEVLNRGEHFTQCKIIETGKICLVKNECVNGEIFDCWQPFANFLSVSKNEIVSVIHDSWSGYVYIRNAKGELGWIPKEAVDIFKSE